MPGLRVGDVVVLHAGTIGTPKLKWHLCVSVGDNRFLRINTKPHWPPNFPLSARSDPCLEHDSYLELNAPVWFDDLEIDDALRYPNNHKGRLSDETLRALAQHIPSVRTLAPEQKRIILDGLQSVLSDK